jgi:formiminotetrahydrofolate cyclodeaminase
MKYIEGKISNYLSDLAARTSAPGGGSAAALSAAMAASLVAMACRFTIGKDKYKSVERRMSVLLSKTNKRQSRLEQLVDLDAAAYLSGDLKKSIKVPAEVARLSYEVAVSAREVMIFGNKNLATDAGLAATLAATSFFAALSYVDINIRWAKTVPAEYKKLARDLRKYRRRVLEIRKQAEAALGSSFRR